MPWTAHADNWTRHLRRFEWIGPSPPELFHFTPERSAQQILHDGVIRPGGGWGLGTMALTPLFAHTVSLTTDAKWFIRMAGPGMAFIGRTWSCFALRTNDLSKPEPVLYTLDPRPLLRAMVGRQNAFPRFCSLEREFSVCGMIPLDRVRHRILRGLQPRMEWRKTMSLASGRLLGDGWERLLEFIGYA